MNKHPLNVISGLKVFTLVNIISNSHDSFSQWVHEMSMSVCIRNTVLIHFESWPLIGSSNTFGSTLESGVPVVLNRIISSVPVALLQWPTYYRTGHGPR